MHFEPPVNTVHHQTNLPAVSQTQARQRQSVYQHFVLISVLQANHDMRFSYCFISMQRQYLGSSCLYSRFEDERVGEGFLEILTSSRPHPGAQSDKTSQHTPSGTAYIDSVLQTCLTSVLITLYTVSSVIKKKFFLLLGSDTVALKWIQLNKGSD